MTIMYITVTLKVLKKSHCRLLLAGKFVSRFSIIIMDYCINKLVSKIRKSISVFLHKTRSPAIAEGPRDAGVPVEIW